ncbi:hypothetical protein PAPHI01_0128 [Pancytospora philotis]|nr:hypothetical protein PAPHI01_0128 [Pancytospora philotis]
MQCQLFLRMWSVAVLGVQCGPMPGNARLDDGEIRVRFKERECALIENLFINLSALIRPMERRCRDFYKFKHFIDSELENLSYVNCSAQDETSEAFFDKIKSRALNGLGTFYPEDEPHSKWYGLYRAIKKTFEDLSCSQSYNKHQGNAPLSLIDPSDIFALLEEAVSRASVISFSTGNLQSLIAQVTVFLSVSFAQISQIDDSFITLYSTKINRCFNDYSEFVYTHLVINRVFADKDRLKSAAQMALDKNAQYSKLCEASKKLLDGFKQLAGELDRVRDKFARKLNALELSNAH